MTAQDLPGTPCRTGYESGTPTSQGRLQLLLDLEPQPRVDTDLDRISAYTGACRLAFVASKSVCDIEAFALSALVQGGPLGMAA
jgi:hypothetical protein